MTIALDYSPADVAKHLLVLLGAGTDADLAPRQAWPVFVDSEPDEPASCITAYDTSGKVLGKDVTGVNEFFGVQVRVRSASWVPGWRKAWQVAKALDEAYRETVAVGAARFLVESVIREGPVLNMGKEPSSTRRLFSLNVQLVLRQL